MNMMMMMMNVFVEAHVTVGYIQILGVAPHFHYGKLMSLGAINCISVFMYRGADKSLVRPGRKQARKHVRDARDFNNIETRAVIKFFFFLQGKAPKEIHAILTETFLTGTCNWNCYR